MKIKKLLWTAIILIVIAFGIVPAFGDPCASSCNSTDPLEVAQCLLECEDS